MSKFFINRPIVAMVISIIMLIAGGICVLVLPTAQFPNIADPMIQVKATYPGADATTVALSVATPIEQQMSGVNNMNYMYSLNANNGQSTLYIDFDIKTDPNTDQILAQMRQGQAASQLPTAVNNYGVVVQQSTAAPMMLFDLYAPDGRYDAEFLANYAIINLNDALTRVPGIASVTVFGAGQYAMRLWVKPDQLAKLQITVPEIVNAIQTQNTVNPAGQIGGDPIPVGQEFTYAVRAQGRLVTEEQFGNMVVRAKPDGSIVRVKDVARVQLGAQLYNIRGRLDGKPAAVLAIYQLPEGNLVKAAAGAKALMAEAKKTVSARPRIQRRPGYVASRDRGHRRNRAHAGRSLGSRHHRGLHLSPGLARHADPSTGRAGFARWHVHALPAARLLHQHALAVWHGAGHRLGGG